MKKKLLGLLVIICSMFVVFSTASAEEYFSADENVNDSGTYEHSHFEAGNIVTSKSNVNGLSFIAGSNVDITGNKEYGFFAGETVKVNGIIEKDLFAAGNTVTISKDANVGRDAYLAGNSITIEGSIDGAIFAAGSLIKFDNVTINGDVTIAANTIDIAGDVKINGTLKVNDDAIINNEKGLSANKTEKYQSTRVNIDFSSKMSDYVLDILKTIFTGLLLVLIFPKIFKKIKYDLQPKDIGMNLLYGLLVLFAVPMICVVALSIIVGLSVSIMLLMLYIIAIMISTILASTVIGYNIYTNLFNQKENIYLSMIIGILIVKIVAFIPVFGPICSILVFLYGLGMIWQLFLDRNK